MSLTVGLALGGGGARGVAHIGVLQVLHNNGITIDKISGTSAGAVIGAMYAYSKDPDWIEKRLREFVHSDQYQSLGFERMQDQLNPHSAIGQMAKFVRDRIVMVMSQQKSFIVKRERVESVIRFLIPAENFHELQIPLIVTASDLQSGEAVYMKSGNLIDAVVQSCSIPGFVQPTERDEQLLVDGGVINPIPVEILKNKAGFIIAISINKNSLPEMKQKNIYEILTRSDQITSDILARMQLEKADFVIQPNVGGLHWSRFDEFDTFLTNGREATKLTLKDLKTKLKRKKNIYFQWKQKLGFTS